MNPQTIINQIFSQQQVTDASGKNYPLDSNIDELEGHFISNLIRQNNYTKTIEIGCAYGLSSLYICDALAENTNAHHTIIDPFQTTDWHGIGLKHLNQANIDFYTHLPQKSEFALPKLAEKGEQFDFAFIDGWHTLDHTLIDFFYLNRLIRTGGMILIDDAGMLAIRKLIRYLINYPAYQIVGGIPLQHSTKRNMAENIKKLTALAAKIIPAKLRHEIFSPELLKSDKQLGIDVSMIALKKTAEDQRPWNWYQKF